MSKVSIIGAGNVGATAAREIAQCKEVEQIVLLDIKEGVAEGKAIDITQALSLMNNGTSVIGVTNDYSMTVDSDVVVITSGMPRKPGMTREELVGVNSEILKTVLDNVSKYSPNTIYIIVSNPVDTLTYFACKYLNIPSNRVIGMAGELDSARFCYYLSEALNVPKSKVMGYVIGGHGDTTMVPIMSEAYCGEEKVEKLLSKEQQEEVIEKTMKGGATLTSLIGTSAWYAPAVAIAAMVHFIVANSNTYVPCSVYRKEYEICIGSLVRIGSSGVTEIITENYLNTKELEAFIHSVEAVKKVNEALQLCE